MNLEQLKEDLYLTLKGAQDASGKTPLDCAIESIRLDTESGRNEFTLLLAQLLSELAEQGAEPLRLGRYLVRRTGVKDRGVADKLRLLLASKPAKNIGVRLWLLLILMDLGFPPTLAYLNEDNELRRSHIGEWLTLVSANESYTDVKDAFVRAAADGLLDERLLVLESVRKHHLGLHSFRSMRRIDASLRKVSALRLRHSQSLASLRHRPSQAKVRSTIQRLGKTTKRWA
jgi:hypothetical protein